MNRYFYICAMLAAFAACTELQDVTEVEKTPVNADAIAFTADIQAVTKATDLAFEEGDAISVFATLKNAPQESNYAQNVKYTYRDALFTTSADLSYPDEYTTLSFFAVYPYGDYTTPEFTFSVNKDQSSHKAYTSSDLMTASKYAKNQEVVDMTFSHRMAKVIIKLNAANLPAGDQSVTFNDVLYTAEADLAYNIFSGKGKKADVVACPNGTNSFKVVLPPQNIDKGTEFVNVKIGDKTYVWTVEADLILSSGVEYTYTLTLKEANVSFTSDINPWNTPS